MKYADLLANFKDISLCKWYHKRRLFKVYGHPYLQRESEDNTYDAWSSFWLHLSYIFKRFWERKSICTSGPGKFICGQCQLLDCTCKKQICFLGYQSEIHFHPDYVPFKTFGSKQERIYRQHLQIIRKCCFNKNPIETIIKNILGRKKYQQRKFSKWKEQQHQTWIGPLSSNDGKRKTGLEDKIYLSPENTIGILSNDCYHVWGFNSSDYKKWCKLKKGDLIVFGNTKRGFNLCGTVHKKFIWCSVKESQCVFPDGNSWLWGYTLQLFTSPNCLTSDQVQHVLNVKRHYQTQCLLTEVLGHDLQVALGHCK
jgi:hypothetical protein